MYHPLSVRYLINSFGRASFAQPLTSIKNLKIQVLTSPVYIFKLTTKYH